VVLLLFLGRTAFENSKELILELVFGEGGQDSKLFVDDLLSAYIKYGTSLGFRSEILTSELGHCIVRFSGKGVWKAFKNEPGKHCVQRVPPTERGGRRQTSMISVAVLTLPPENHQEPLREQDLKITCQTGKQKAGGQNVNKVHSAVRAVHMPTGLSVFINGRDQGQNKKEALKILTAKVNQRRYEKEAEAYYSNRKKQLGGGGRGEKIRTYNFIESRIVDHRLGTKTGNIKEVMKGNFKLILEGEKE
jgi:peptide chain release factor 1